MEGHFNGALQLNIDKVHAPDGTGRNILESLVQLSKQAIDYGAELVCHIQSITPLSLATLSVIQ
jgi:hypothetical protein